MKDRYSKCFAELYRLLPVVGILLLALLGIWWGSRTTAADETVQPPDLRTNLCQPTLTAKQISAAAVNI